MKHFLVFAFALMFTFVISKAQQNVYLNIHHKLGNVNFALNSVAQNDLSHSYKVTRASYYISSIKIIHDGGTETTVADKYILVKDGTNLHELLGNFAVTNVEGIKFSIGVEAPTNNADPNLWAASHPLSPKSPSMHWGWSAGYLFVALEGLAGSNLNTIFQMHGLNNANYFSQTQMAAGVVSGNEIEINLDADINQALKGIDVSAGPIDHGQNQTDLDVLRNFRDHVFSPTAINTGISFEEITGINIYPNPITTLLFIDNAKAAKPADRIVLVDALGKTVMTQKLDITSSNALEIETAGIYPLMLMNESTLLGTKLIVKK